MTQRLYIISGLFLVLASYAIAQQGRRVIPLDTPDGLELHNVTAEAVVYNGLKGIRVTGSGTPVRGDAIVVIPGPRFSNGTIELELSGEPGPGAGAFHRGFVGVAFRLQETEPLRYECFYLRPVNGRADDQLQRNHSVQYVSHPDWPWSRLREETPGQYETYTDLVPGEWTKVKIDVAGQEARLYVNNVPQPTLIVKDLKMGVSTGAVALWLESATLAHFRNLVITPH